MTITGKSILAKFFALLVVGLLLAVSTVTSVSQSKMPSEITAWFETLQADDAGALDKLLADDAVIELRDLGISQTKSEFIDSLDQWTQLNGDAKILKGAATTSGKQTSLNVCYRFASNEVMNRETFFIENGQITKSVQERISETCTDF